MTTVLVTGAAGFVGRHLIDELSRKAPDAQVIGLDREVDIPDCSRRIVCDLAGAQAFQTLQAIEPPDYVVHLAAQSDVHFSLIRPDIYIRDNVLATSNLVQALARHTSIKRLLLVSSCEVYGNTSMPAVETHSTRPRTPYAASKLAQEYVALSAIDHQSLPTVVCRLFNNYGRGQQGNRLIPRVMQALRWDRPFELVGDGSQTRDWTAVEDTCDALIRVLFEPRVEVGDIFNIASEEVYSVLQVLELCESVSGKSLLTNRSVKDSGHLELSAGNSQKLRSVTGWRNERNLPSFLASIVKEMA
jgi:nucleoside-diphosphate-sugar epimerase